MATVLEQIGTALSGNDATVRVDAQAGNVLAVGSLLDGLVQNAPPALSQLQRAFGSLELPDFPLSGFVTRIADVRAAVPSDASGVLGGTLSSIGSIDAELGGALATSLRNLLNAFERIRALADTRFTCSDGAGAGAGSGGNGNGGGAGGGAGGNGGAGGGGAPAVVGNQTPTFVASTTQAREVLAKLPVPFNLRALLKFLHDASEFRRDARVPAILPLFDDLRDPINTLLTWETLTPAQLLAAFAATLQDAQTFVRTGVESTLDPLFTDVDALLAGVPVNDLQEIAERITIRLGELRTAVQSGNVAGTAAAVVEINARLDAYDVLRPTLVPVLAPAAALRTRLLEVAGDLDIGMASMISVLKPTGSALTRIPEIQLDIPEVLHIWLQGLSDWLNDIANAIDLSVIQGPISTVAGTLRNVAEGLQQAIVAITVNVQSVFNQVQSLLDTLDPVQMQAEVEAAVQAFRSELIARISALVGPARDAVMEVVQSIDEAVDAFSPADVIDALTDAIDALESVLGEGEAGQAITAIHDGLEKLAAELSSVSFTPTADSVIQTMDGLRAALEAIDPAQMPAPVADALKAAASVLPADLEPITDPIIDTFGDIVDSGPAPVLAAVRDAPKQVIEAVRGFDPESLVGDDLTAPFQEVLRQMEDFRPSELLDPVEDGLADFKEQLQRAASPGRVAELLETPFQELKSAIDNFDPNALVDPLDEALSTVTEKLLDLLPVDETFAIMDTGLAAVQRVVSTIDDLVALVRGLRQAAGALVDVRGQLQTWVNEVLAKIDGISDTSSLNPHLSALRAALDDTRAAGVTARFTARSASARTALNNVNGGTRLAALIQAHRGVPRAELLALPNSAQKTAIQNVLNRFDPLLPEFGAPWKLLGDLRQALLDGEAELQTLLTVWDDRFHAVGGSLAELRQTEATAAQLKAWAQESFQANLVEPVARLLFFLEPVRNLFDAFLVPFEELVTTVNNKLAAILTGPDSLTAIRQSLGQITTIISDLDLEFLRTSLNQLFQSIRTKLEQVSPAQLGAALDESFAALLDTITIDLILPPADVAQIDETYAAIVEKLRLLDPATLVTEVVKPLFEQKVVPLIEKFDIAPSLEIIVEKLGGMDDELREEISRVNEAYKKLLGALPDGTNPSVSVSVSVAA